MASVTDSKKKAKLSKEEKKALKAAKKKAKADAAEAQAKKQRQKEKKAAKKRKLEESTDSEVSNSKKAKKDKSSKKDKKAKDKKCKDKTCKEDKKDKKSKKKDKKSKKKDKKSKKKSKKATESSIATPPPLGPIDGDGFRKNFSYLLPSQDEFSQSEVDAYRAKHEMQVHNNSDNIKPIRSFEESGFPESIRGFFRTKGFTTPTPVQAQCWPLVMSGRDVISIAETGSGKTLGFMLPAIVHILDQPPCTKQDNGPAVLVIAPTRELALQISAVVEEVGEHCGVRSCTVYGGMPKRDQIQKIKQGISVLVATVGRLLDLAQNSPRDLSLNRVTMFILDEADRMLDMGFEPEIRKVVAMLRKDRQTLMFSATWPEQVQKIGKQFLTNPAHMTIGSLELAANKRIEQTVEIIADERDKQYKLKQLFRQYQTKGTRVLVFALYKKEASRLENFLRKQGHNVGGIHGDKSQSDRMHALANFKSGDVPILVATDVAARGLDIPDVEFVFNVTFPLTIEDYIHRIGRTGRAGKTGISHTFFTDKEKHLGGELIKVLQDAGQPVPEKLKTMGVFTKKKKHGMYGDHHGRHSDKPMPKATKIVFD